MTATSSSPAIHIGDHVCAVDGIVLGAVIEVRPGAFCIDRNGAATWLPFDAVFTIEAFTVTLICDVYGLRRYVIPAPAEAEAQP